MKEIINVTIDGDTYRKFKETFDGVKQKKHPIDFDHEQFYSYGWTFYTEDEALNRMANKYEFMLFKHDEQVRNTISNQERKIKELELDIMWLNRTDF